MMVSSKFSRSAHAFRVPSICKDKLKPKPPEPPEPPGPPLPGDLLKNDYVFHGTYFGYSWDYEGTLALPIDLAYTWHSPWPPPDGGVYCKFTFYWFNYKYFSEFWLDHLVGPTINFVTAAYQWVPNGEFDTGIFPYTRAGYIGEATGRIRNLV